MVKKILASSVTLVCLLSGVAAAQAPTPTPAESADDYARESLYGGLGLIYAVENFDTSEFKPGSTSSNAWGIDVRAGYRFHPNIAGEVNFQWVNDFELTAPGFKTNSSSRTLTANVKGYPLTGRIQPYAVGGIGILYEQTKGRGSLQEFEGRLGLGIDFFITNNIVANLECAYGLPISDLNDYLFFPIVFGLQYHTD